MVPSSSTPEIYGGWLSLLLARGEIHSAGSARYAGNTMKGTVIARVPGPNGQPIDAPGHIAGRYFAPCDAK
jgi:hypothetical protein